VALTSLLVLGALTPLVKTGTDEFARHAMLLALVVGITRVIVGVLGLGFVAYLMSQPVVAAFTLSAAMLIAGSQVPSLLGVTASSDNPLVASVRAVTHPEEWAPAAIVIGLGTVAVTLLARRISPLVPGAFLAAVVALLLSRAGMVDVAVVGTIPNGYPPLDLDLPWASVTALLLPGVVIALIGFAEPASIARQYASADRTSWSPDREFVGQGLGNLAAGFFQGYPVGGSFSRSALNRLSGARTRWSGMVTGLVVLAVLPFVGVLSELPEAALAGLVIASVLPLLNPRPVTRAWRLSRPQFGVATVTLVVSVLAAPQVQWGVVAGVGCALAVHLWRELRLEVEVWTAAGWSESDADGVVGSDDPVLHVRPAGVLYFGSAPLLETRILDELAEHPELRAVEIHLQRLGRVDLTGALVLRAICNDLARADVPVLLSGAQMHNRRIVQAVFARDPVKHTHAAAGPPQSTAGRDVDGKG
jgi:SulP family sulfate permease